MLVGLRWKYIRATVGYFRVVVGHVGCLVHHYSTAFFPGSLRHASAPKIILCPLIGGLGQPPPPPRPMLSHALPCSLCTSTPSFVSQMRRVPIAGPVRILRSSFRSRFLFLISSFSSQIHPKHSSPVDPSDSASRTTWPSLCHVLKYAHT